MFIPVDIFLDKLHNDGINSNLDAWLCFLGCDNPDIIVNLITKYPKFKAMYSHLYDICRNIEGVMNMFSKELQLMDQNTVKYMMDELQEQLDKAQAKLAAANEQISATNEKLAVANDKLTVANSTISTLNDEKSSLIEENTRLVKILEANNIEN